MSQVAEIVSLCKTITYIFHINNTMGADVQAKQQARAIASMILTMLNGNNSFPHFVGLDIPTALNIHRGLSSIASNA